MYSHNERLYNHIDISKLNDADFCSLPVLIETDNAKVVFTESSLHNYPGMFLEKNKDNNLISKFPNYVLKAVPAGSYDKENGEGSDRTEDIVEEANFIAKLSGSRNLPWRVFIVSDDDRTFVESNLVTILSEKSKIEDTSWIKPGKVAWDWWNSNNIYGVDFKAGINQDTYKYYIDFASENDFTPPSDPSITGKPNFFAILFASILSPILEIISALGPINFIPCLFTISENFAFSDKNPYPGWTASAPVKSTADIIDEIFK